MCHSILTSISLQCCNHALNPTLDSRQTTPSALDLSLTVATSRGVRNRTEGSTLGKGYPDRRHTDVYGEGLSVLQIGEHLDGGRQFDASWMRPLVAVNLRCHPHVLRTTIRLMSLLRLCDTPDHRHRGTSTGI